MVFCSNCGKELEEGAKFCANCGAAVAPAASMAANDATAQTDADASMEANDGAAQTGAEAAPTAGAISGARRGERVQKYESEIFKCPNCGAQLGAFDAVCPECGCEVRGRAASTAVSQFAEKLFAKQDSAKVRLIKNFAVPNTIEDLTEFFVLATSNLDEAKLSWAEGEDDREIAKAWLAKIEQTYNKAKITFGFRPEFQAIEDMYQNKKKAVEEAKKKSARNLYLLIFGCFGFILFLFLLLFLFEK